jgi:hypothetical protein
MICTLKEWQKIYKNPQSLIVQASAVDGSDSWQSHPIGMSYQYLHLSHFYKDLQIGEHSNLVYSAVRDSTDEVRRKDSSITRRKILETLIKNNIANEFGSFQTYFTSLPDYKFVISPEGNGIDCHRHYEALLAGCIPILEKNPLTEEKYSNLPVLFTTDYSEITKEYLESIYSHYLDKQYNFSKLFLNSYSEEEQNLIRFQSKYWCLKLVGREFYI